MALELDRPDVVPEVKAALLRYEKALVENDVTVLDQLFWNDERVVRYGAGENLYGDRQIAAFRAQRPSKGLQRELHNTVITAHGDDLATAWTEFRRPEGWRVVAAHVSFKEE